MSEHTPIDEPAKPSSSQQMTNTQLAIPQTQKSKWKPSLIWLLPLIALLIALSLALKAYLNIGPRIEVSFDSADGLVAGKTTVQFRQVDVGVVRNIRLSEDLSKVIVQIELIRDASNFASKDSQFWVVRPRIGTSGVSGIGTLLSGSYIGVEGGRSAEKKTHFVGLESPPVISSDVPGKSYLIKTNDLGSLDIGSPIYYHRVNVGQVTAYKLSDDGSTVDLQIFVRAPYDQFVTTNARFWQASGIDVEVNSSGFNLKTESLASIIAGGIAFGYPQYAAPAQVAHDKTTFTLWPTQAQAFRKPDGPAHPIVMYFDESLRGLSVGAQIDFMGIDIGKVTAINAEFNAQHTQMRMRVEAMIYPSRLADGSELNPSGEIFKQFIKRGWRAQMRTGNLLTGQNYIAFNKFPQASAASVKLLENGVVDVPTTQTELSGLQSQVATIADKLSKFPLDEIGGEVRQTLKSLNTAINSTDRLIQQMDGKVAPDLQATLDELRKTMRSSESILSTDAPMQQDIRRAVQQMTRAAASVELMADYIEQHPESLIRGKKPEKQNGQK